MITAHILHCSGTNPESEIGLKNALEQRGFETKIVSVTEMQQWARTGSAKGKLMVMPGGRTGSMAIDIASQTGDAKFKWIQNFVKEGGRYLGVCAGGNLGSSDLRYQYYDYAPYTPPKHFEIEGADLLPVSAQGPVAGMGKHFSDTQHLMNPSMGDAAQTKVMIADNEAKSCYYLYGSAFNVNDSDKVEVIARYEKTNTPAIVQGSVGEGLAVLSGVHAEYEPEDVGAKETAEQKQSRNQLMDLIVAALAPAPKISETNASEPSSNDLDTKPAAA